MLSQPSSDRILDLIREALRTKIAPVVSGRESQVALQTIDLMLNSLARRVNCEIHWMREEIAEIEGLARMFLEEGVDPQGRIAATSDVLAAMGISSLKLGDVQREYAAAGHVLTACLEAGIVYGGKYRTEAEGVLAERLAHEVEILGDYHIVGKA